MEFINTTANNHSFGFAPQQNTYSYNNNNNNPQMMNAPFTFGSFQTNNNQFPPQSIPQQAYFQYPGYQQQWTQQPSNSSSRSSHKRKSFDQMEVEEDYDLRPSKRYNLEGEEQVFDNLKFPNESNDEKVVEYIEDETPQNIPATEQNQLIVFKPPQDIILEPYEREKKKLLEVIKNGKNDLAILMKRNKDDLHFIRLKTPTIHSEDQLDNQPRIVEISDEEAEAIQQQLQYQLPQMPQVLEASSDEEDEEEEEKKETIRLPSTSTVQIEEIPDDGQLIDEDGMELDE